MARIILFCDFETRSILNIKDVGAPKYAEHPSTLPLMFVYGNDTGQEQWLFDLSRPKEIPACPERLVRLIENPEVQFHAHNAGFEIAIWDAICVKRWGWPAIDHKRWHCTAARAAAANQPRGLDKVGNRVGLQEKAKKENRGKELIKALCQPTKAQKTYLKTRKDANGKTVKTQCGVYKSGKRKGEPKFQIEREVNKLSVQYLEEQGIETFELTNDEGKTYTYFFNEDPKLMAEFAAYNRKDIVAEREVHKRLPPAHELERPLWEIDLEINRRGIPVDLNLCRGALEVYEVEVNNAFNRIAQLTDGEITKTTQVQRIRKFANETLGFDDDDREETPGAFTTLGDDVIPDWLALNPDGDPVLREIFELRLLAGGTAVGKYDAALRFCQADGRVRDQLLYYGATTTGRWSGKGLQPHNFKREKTLDETFIEAIKTGDHATVEALGALEGLSTFDVLKGCLRGIINAEPGHTLLFSDFAGIESRVLNWLCRNEVKLDLFRRGQDAYIHTALDVYDCQYGDIADWSDKKGKWLIKDDHSEKRQIGKACELGLGYGMGWFTFKLNAAKAGSLLDDAFANRVVTKWRDANPEIPEFWKRIERACKFVIYNKRKRVDVNGLKVFWDPRGYLCIQLPSGRCLRYYGAQIHKDRDPSADPDRNYDSIYYLDGGKMGSKYNGYRISTYGGKLCENIIQAIARDILVHSLMLVHKQGLDIVLHVHDEIVIEALLSAVDRSFEILHKSMSTCPPWAADLPLEAETQISFRFTK